MAQHAYQPYPPAMMGQGAPHPTASPDDTILLARLRAQVEFYFSPQNLARDTFLSSLLEKNDNAVPVETIANFPKVRELHAIGRLGMMNVPIAVMPPADPSLLCRALEGSHVVTVSNNGQWIHLIPSEAHDHGKATPNQETGDTAKSPPSSPSSPSTTASSAGVPTHPIQLKERTTVIVRDVPEGCTVEEMVHVFSTNAFQPRSANHAHDAGNTWYVSFHSENDAMAALAATQNQTIHGMPIHAEIKNEGAMLPPQSIPAQFPQQHVPQQYAYPAMMQGYPVYDPYYGVPVMPQQHYGYGVPVHYVNNGMYAPPPLYNEVRLAPPVPPQHQGPPPQGYGPPPPPHQTDNNNMRPPQQQQQPYRKPNYPKNRRNRKQNRQNSQNYYDNRNNGYDNNRQQNNNYEREHVAKEEDGAPKDPPLQNRDADSTAFTNSNDGKKKNGRKNKNKRQGKNEMLGQDQFPALVENGAKGEKSMSAETTGYAAALKKKVPFSSSTGESTSAALPLPNQNTTPSGESTSQTQQLEQDMSKLNVSNTAEAEFWEVDDPPVPEVW